MPELSNCVTSSRLSNNFCTPLATSFFSCTLSRSLSAPIVAFPRRSKIVTSADCRIEICRPTPWPFGAVHLMINRRPLSSFSEPPQHIRKTRFDRLGGRILRAVEATREMRALCRRRQSTPSSCQTQESPTNFASLDVRIRRKFENSLHDFVSKTCVRFHHWTWP